jgi:hypothetical protein
MVSKYCRDWSDGFWKKFQFPGINFAIEKDANQRGKFHIVSTFLSERLRVFPVTSYFIPTIFCEKNSFFPQDFPERASLTEHADHLEFELLPVTVYFVHQEGVEYRAALFEAFTVTYSSRAMKWQIIAPPPKGG